MEEKKCRADSIREDRLFENRENVRSHMSYAQEKARNKVVSQGRTDLLEITLATPPDGNVGVLSRDELRNEKNLLISSITLFTRAAIEGGLHEELAFAMSDSYIQEGEACNSIEEIYYIYGLALREFTWAVAEKGENHYSDTIEKACRYIRVHLHEDITLEKISEAIGISTYYLSRLFKKEMGKSLVIWTQEERIEAAKNMLICTEHSATEISEYLHFSTQSYFIKIFKQHTGKTPAVYRKYHRGIENEQDK